MTLEQIITEIKGGSKDTTFGYIKHVFYENFDDGKKLLSQISGAISEEEEVELKRYLRLVLGQNVG